MVFRVRSNPENKCLASTRTIADYSRMPEISGVPAYTPEHRSSGYLYAQSRAVAKFGIP